MSNIQELRSRIAVVNSTSAKLNEQRNRNLGMRETLERQRNNAIASYKEKYGVDLTQVSVDEEYSRLLQEKEKEVTHLEGIISLITAGDYASARAMSGVDADAGVSDPVVSTPAQDIAVASPVGVTSPSPLNGIGELVNGFTAPSSIEPAPTLHASGSDDVVKDVASFVAPPPVLPTAPVSQPPVSSPSVSAPIGGLGSGLDLSGLSAPISTTNKATDFSSVLSGEPFNPNNV